METADLVVRGARTHNLKNIDLTLPVGPADHHYRRQRLGQVVARVRYDLRGRPAAVRRVAVRLRAPVPRADGEARRRSDRRHRTGDCHPPEKQRPQSALDGRHDDRDSRLHAAAVRPRRADVLPQLRQGSRARDGRSRRAPARRPAVRHPAAARFRHPRRRDQRRRSMRARWTSWPRSSTRRTPRRQRRRRTGVKAPGASGRRRPPWRRRSRCCDGKGLRACSSTDARSPFDEVNPSTLPDRSMLKVVVDRDSARRRRPAPAPHRFDRDVVSRRRRRRLGRRGPARPRVRGAGGTVHRFSERFECRNCGIAYEDPQPRLFSFNNPFGACPTCHGFGNIIELDMDLVVPDRTKSIVQGAIEPWSKPHYRAQLADLKKAAKKAKIRLDVPWAELTDDERRFVVDGDDDFDGIRGFFRWLERKKYKVHVRVFLSRYRGYLTCPDCGGARLRREARDVQVAGRTIDKVSALTVREAQGFFTDLESHAERRGDRREGPEGDPPAAVVPERRRPRLSDARPAVVDAVGRRGAAHQPRDVTGLGARRHAIRARRAVDRASFARQPAAHRDSSPAARSGQYRARRRTRRRHDSCRRSHRRSRSGRRRAGRARRVLGNARRADAGAALADVEVPATGARHPGADLAAARDRTESAAARRDRAQPEERRRRDSAEHADVRDRRQRFGQVDAGPRRPLRGHQARERAAGTSASALSERSRARNTSATPCSWTRRRSAERRGRIR